MTTTAIAVHIPDLIILALANKLCLLIGKAIQDNYVNCHRATVEAASQLQLTR